MINFKEEEDEAIDGTLADNKKEKVSKRKINTA